MPPSGPAPVTGTRSIPDTRASAALAVVVVANPDIKILLMNFPIKRTKPWIPSVQLQMIVGMPMSKDTIGDKRSK